MSANFKMSLWCHLFDQNSNENIFKDLSPDFFVASWGLPGSFKGLPGGLVSNNINKEAYRMEAPKKLPGRPKEAIKTIRAEILPFLSKQLETL